MAAGGIEEDEAPAWRWRMRFDNYGTFVRLGMTVLADAPFSPDAELDRVVRAAASVRRGATGIDKP